MAYPGFLQPHRCSARSNGTESIGETKMKGWLESVGGHSPISVHLQWWQHPMVVALYLLPKLHSAFTSLTPVPTFLPSPGAPLFPRFGRKNGGRGTRLLYERAVFHPWLAMSSVWLTSNDNAFIAQWAALWPQSLSLANFHGVHLAQSRYIYRWEGRPLQGCPFPQPASCHN